MILVLFNIQAVIVEIVRAHVIRHDVLLNLLLAQLWRHIEYFTNFNSIGVKCHVFLFGILRILISFTLNVFPVVFVINFLYDDVEIEPDFSVINFFERVKFIIVGSSICINF